MAERRQQRADRAIRPGLRSPGRPPPRRKVEREFWRRIAEGLTSEDAAAAVGVSGPVGTRWFRDGGGMSPISLAGPSGRYLSFAEREEIAILRAQGHGVRTIARQLDRPACTISRELRRNAATRNGALEYRATTAQWHADRSARRPKPAKLAVNPILRDYVQDRLAGMIATPDGAPIVGPRSCGRGAGPCIDSTDAGRQPGAQNRFLVAFGSTSPRMR